MKNKTQRYGIFYKTHGKWTTVPYEGYTFTEYQAKRNPTKTIISHTKNYVLKRKVEIRPVNG